MRVAILALNFAAGSANSHEAHLPQLVNAMVRMDQGHRYVLFLRSDNKSSFPPVSGSVTHIVFPSPGRHKWIQVIYEQLIVPLILIVSKVDLVHFTANIRPAFLPCKSVGTIHWVISPIIAKDFPFVKRLYFSYLGRLSVNKAERVIAVSESCRRHLIAAQRIPAEKAQVVYHGVSTLPRPGNEECTDFMTRHGIRQGYLLYVGTSATYKNLQKLLEAYAYARLKYGVKNQLVMAGNIDREVVREGESTCEVFRENPDWWPEVVCVGYVPYQRMSLLYAGASMTISLSLQESFGLVLLESFASGVPAIVSTIPAFVEVADGAALLVNPHDTAAIAAAINAVLSDEKIAQQLIRNGKTRARAFSWEGAARKTLDVYAAALTPSSAGLAVDSEM
jgi:glycosyltransferase involved in cell wall biosynthesis